MRRAGAIELPAAGSGRAASIVEREGEPVAAIVHDESLREERDLIRTVGAAAALRARERAARRRAAGQARGAARVARADRAGGGLGAPPAGARPPRRRAAAAGRAVDHAAPRARAGRLRPGARRAHCSTKRPRSWRLATKELRELARGIHPAVLTDRGLGAALDALAGRAPLPSSSSPLPQERLPAPIESAAYFVVSEALTNVAKYAQATTPGSRSRATTGA